MRRSIATAVLLQLFAALLAPALLATITVPTPACCRSAGRHHCSAVVPIGGLQIQQTACPYRRPVVFSLPAAPQPVSTVAAPADAHPFLQEFYPELFVPEGEQSHPERSPPPTFSMK